MSEFVSLAGLRERGWTDALVRRFLGEPDKLARNPHYRKAAPMRLYLLARVVSAEGADEFKAALDGAAKRSQSARSVADKKRSALVAEAEAMPIRVEAMPLETLRRRAINNYNDRGPRRDDDYSWMPARHDSDALFLERISVNFARHCLTEYDEALEAQFAKVGVNAAVATIRRRVYELIAATWPELSAECTRQLVRRESP